MSSIKNLTVGCWSSLDGVRLRFFAFIFLFVAAYSLELAAPWAIGRILGAFAEFGVQPAAYAAAVYGLTLYVALRLGSSACHHLARYLQTTVGYLARMNVLCRTFSALLSHGLSWHLKSHSGERLAQLNRSAKAAESAVGTYLWQILEGVVKTVIATAALVMLDRAVSLMVVLMIALTVAVIVYFNRRMLEQLRINNRFEDKLNRICVDSCANIVTVKTLRLEDSASLYLNRQLPEGLKYAKSLARLNELKWAAVNGAYTALIAGSLAVYLWRRGGSAEAIDIAAVYVLINYLDKIFQSVQSFTGYYGGIMEACTAYEDAVSIEQQEKPRETSGEISGWQKLQFEKLGYEYSPDARSRLQEVSFELKRGERIALVGPSGAGKSTLLKLLAGLVEGRGNLHVDAGGEPADCRDLRIMLIPQEPEMFSETLRYNLTVGRQIPDEEVVRALDLCQLGSWSAHLDDGFGVDLAEKGLNISGGERQRLALARGLLCAGEKDIVLLDEPTSSLDPRTEYELLKSVFAAYPDHAIIASCHRWSLLPLFDKVMYMENGSIKVCLPAAEFVANTETFVPHVSVFPTPSAAVESVSDAA